MDSLLWLGSPDCVSHVGLFLNRVDSLHQTVLQGCKALATLGEARVSGYPSQAIWRQKYLCFSRKFRLTFRQILPITVPLSLTPSNPHLMAMPVQLVQPLALSSLSPRWHPCFAPCPLYLVILFLCLRGVWVLWVHFYKPCLLLCVG